MKRRDFMKFIGAAPLAFVDFEQFATKGKAFSKNILGTPPHEPIGCSHLVADLQGGDHLIIAGRPSMGKTAVAINLLSELAFNKNQGCAYFSLELSKEKLVKRLLFLNADITNYDMSAGHFLQTDFSRLTNASEQISNANIFINDSSGLSVEEMHRKIENLKISGVDIKYVFVDYFQLAGAEKKYDCRHDQVSDSLLQLKRLAQTQNVIVISLAQLNRRAADSRPKARPILEDLRETNAYDNIDKAVLLHRFDYYDKGLGGGQIEMIIDKNKNNKKSLLVAPFDRKNSKMSNYKVVNQ